jgi:hypothetical protein
MRSFTLRAHFDGERILLDEPYELRPNAELLVTVLSDEQSDRDREEWYRFSRRNFQQAYGDDEPEYTLDMVKEINPDYEGR